MTDALSLDALEAAANAAESGPWICDEGSPLVVGTPKPWYPAGVYHVITVLEGGEEYTDDHNAAAQANARHIASASPDVVLRLVGEIRRLREALAPVVHLLEALEAEARDFGRGPTATYAHPDDVPAGRMFDFPRVHPITWGAMRAARNAYRGREEGARDG